MKSLFQKHVKYMLESCNVAVEEHDHPVSEVYTCAKSDSGMTEEGHHTTITKQDDLKTKREQSQYGMFIHQQIIYTV